MTETRVNLHAAESAGIVRDCDPFVGDQATAQCERCGSCEGVRPVSYDTVFHFAPGASPKTVMVNLCHQCSPDVEPPITEDWLESIGFKAGPRELPSRQHANFCVILWMHPNDSATWTFIIEDGNSRDGYAEDSIQVDITTRAQLRHLLLGLGFTLTAAPSQSPA